MPPRPRGRFDDLQDRILKSRIRTDARNRLLYEVGSETLVLDGAWALTSSDALAFTVRARGQQPPQTVTLKSELLTARAHALVFAVQQAQRGGTAPTHRLTLSGRWSADAKNRLVFLVEKADGDEDRLTLQGGWEVGPHHEVLYRWRQRSARRRVAEERTLTFAGAWDITGSDRLVYRLVGGPDSAFEFRAAIQNPSLQAREGRIVYQAGIGLSGGRRIARRVTLFGVWKLNRDASVSFEIPYAGGRRQAMQFGGMYAVTPRSSVIVELTDRRGRPLGLSVAFTRDVSDTVRWFLRLKKDDRETAALAGVQVRF